MCSSLEEVLHGADLVILEARAVDRETLRRDLRPAQVVIDFVNLEKGRRLPIPTTAVSAGRTCQS
jgi:hypothetical protein